MNEFFDQMQILTGEKYHKLIDFLLTKCDTVTFFLPNYGTIFECHGNPREEYKDSKLYIKHNNDKFINYKENLQSFLSELENKIIDTYTDVKYFDEISNYEREIYVLKFDSETADVFKTFKSFYWRCPEQPEDLRFFSNGVCYLETIMHEDEFFVYDDSDDTIEFFDSLGLDFYIGSSGVGETLEEI